MSKVVNYSKSEVIDLLLHMQEIFEVARLVDVSMTKQLEVSSDHTDLIQTAYNCYAVWNMEHRCSNCISAQAYRCKSKLSKFEFVNDEVYYVVAKYITVDGVPYMMELVTKIDDETLFSAYGKSDFAKTITDHNKKLYVDPLTKAYNRNYYETQLLNVSRVTAVAMIDVDHFKGINDTFGHAAGDLALSSVVATINKSISQADSIIRYGGDEFLILFQGATRDTLPGLLEKIRGDVEAMTFEEYPDMKITLSIGGVVATKEMGPRVLTIADENLYKAKETRNRVVWC